MNKGITLILIVLFAAALFLNPPVDPAQVDLDRAFAPMSRTHPLGTDHLGRDIRSLMVYGFARTGMVVLTGSGIALSIGVTLGLISGYREGPVETGIQIVSDISLIVPSFIVALITGAFLGLTPLTAGLTLGFFDIGTYVNQTNSLTKKIKRSSFIEAKQVLGISSGRILSHHILPHIFTPVSTVFANKASGLILQFAALSFIGLGTDPTKPDWGALLFQYRIFSIEYPRLVLIPTFGIFLFALSFHLAFDGTTEPRRYNLYD